MITIQVEEVKKEFFIEASDLLKEAARITQRGFEGINQVLDKGKNELINVDFDHYDRMKKLGLTHLSTVRDNGKLVGLWCLFLAYHHQAKGFLTASTDLIYVDKEYRNNGTVAQLMSFTEKKLKNRGVKQLFFGLNTQNDVKSIDKMLERSGWKLGEYIYDKEI